jgi:hypothetical protein
LEQTFSFSDIKNQKTEWLKKELQKTFLSNMGIKVKEEEIHVFVTKLYEKGYSALDIIQLIEDGLFPLSQEKRYELLVAFNKVRKEFRNEKLLMMFIIHFVFLDKETVLENISFM